MPLCFGASLSVRARQIAQSASTAIEFQTFWPTSRQRPSSRTAEVVNEARSEPAPGSLNSWHHVSSPRSVGSANRSIGAGSPPCRIVGMAHQPITRSGRSTACRLGPLRSCGAARRRCRRRVPCDDPGLFGAAQHVGTHVMCLIAWKRPIGRPNCSRIFAYSDAISVARPAMPAAAAATAVTYRFSTDSNGTSRRDAGADQPPRQLSFGLRRGEDRALCGCPLHQPEVTGDDVVEQVLRAVVSADQMRGYRGGRDRSRNHLGTSLFEHRAQVREVAAGSAAILRHRHGEKAEVGDGRPQVPPRVGCRVAGRGSRVAAIGLPLRPKARAASCSSLLSSSEPLASSGLDLHFPGSARSDPARFH